VRRSPTGRRTGSYIRAFIDVHAANYPVQAKDLPLEWNRYPRMIFVGSEFGTTLFGIVPWVLVLLFLWRLVRRRLDRADWLLFGFWGIVFGLIEFFPAGFSFDKYYTPRIFRYLAPISPRWRLRREARRRHDPRLASPLAVATASALLVANVSATSMRRCSAASSATRSSASSRSRRWPAACRRRDHARLLARIAAPQRPRRDGVSPPQL
jgi:hypothetical protein